jgi:hypothetical protein
MQPYDGIRYLGMVTRADGTFEWASQQLTSPLLKGKTYQFQLYVAQASEYLSQTKDDNHFLDFDTPCSLQIVGTNSECDIYETLAETEGITSKQWQKIIVRFTPSKNYSHLQIQARYSTKTPARGNLLVDNVSDILPLDSVKWQPTVALPSVDTTEIADKMAAEIYIAEAVRSLQINQAHYHLPQEWFLQRGKLQFGNLAFTNIIRAASKIPNSKLVIHLKRSAFDDWEEWKTVLYRYCKSNYNIDEKRIVIDYYKRSDRKVQWISDTDMFAIRLQSELIKD